MKKSKKKTIITIVILVIGAAGLIFYFGFYNHNKTEYGTDTVRISDIQTTVTIKGTIRGIQEKEVYSDSGSKIEKIPVKKGDKVKKDQVLAVLDIEKLTQQYDIACIDLDSAKKYYSDMKALFDAGSVPQASVDEAKWALDKAQLLCDTYDIDDAGEILSPVDGIITETNCVEGGYAAFTVIQRPAFIIEDRSKLILKAEAKEKNMTSIYVGQEAEITSEAMGSVKITGKVTEIAPSGRVNQGNGTVVVPVTIELDDEAKGWMTGVTGKAKLVLTAEGVLTVPMKAVSEKNDDTCVYVLNDDGTVTKINVEAGINDGKLIEIISEELTEGDKVIINPDEYVFN